MEKKTQLKPFPCLDPPETRHTALNSDFGLGTGDGLYLNRFKVQNFRFIYTFYSLVNTVLGDLFKDKADTMRLWRGGTRYFQLLTSGRDGIIKKTHRKLLITSAGKPGW